MSSGNIVNPEEEGFMSPEHEIQWDEYLQMWGEEWWCDEAELRVWGEDGAGFPVDFPIVDFPIVDFQIPEVECFPGVFVCREGGNQREVLWEAAQSSWCEMSSALLWADMEPLEVVEALPAPEDVKERWADMEDEDEEDEEDEEEWNCFYADQVYDIAWDW
jgi:hypothetical protein